MQGPTPWWDQPPDSRDNTVSMPRVDPAEFADRESSARPAAPGGGRWTAPERPAFGDPYALPAQPESTRPVQPEPTQPARPGFGERTGRRPEPERRPTAPTPADLEPAAPFDAEAGLAPEPDAAELPDQGADARPVLDAASEPEAAAPGVEPAATPRREDGSAPAAQDGAARQLADGSAPAAQDGAARQLAAGAMPVPAPVATTSAEHSTPAEQATPAGQTTPAATPKPVAAAPAARSIPATGPPRVAPVAAEHAADPRWRDPQSDQLTGSASLAPPARSAGRPIPEHQPAAETSLGAASALPAAADRPATGSLADLRARLARLPVGHPASPYDDTGRSKPAPTRLRMLELGLPARPAGVAAYADRPGFGHDDESDGFWPDAATGSVGPAPAVQGASDTVHRSAATPDAATQPTGSEGQRAGTPGQPATASQAEATSGAEKASGTSPATDGSATNGAAPANSTGTARSGRSARNSGVASDTGTATNGAPPNGAAPGNSTGTASSTETASSGGTAGSAAAASGPLPVADDVAPLPRPAATSDGTNRETRPRPVNGAAATDRPADRTAASDRRNRSATAQPPTSGQNGRRGRSTSADWQRPYDVPSHSDHRSDGPAPLDRTEITASWPAVDVPPRNGDHRNGNRARGLMDATPPASARRQAQRSQRWPTDPDQPLARPPAAERSSRPAMASRLSPEQQELLDRILTACRAAEGRNAVGGYGSSGLTPAMMRIAAQLPFGGLAPGSEADTLKSADRLAAKLARLVARQPGRSAEQVAASISDAIRYAFTFDIATYTEGTLLVHRKLKTQGFELEARRNRWDSPEYKGVFTRWRDPAHGLPFEVQFHTGQSWAFVKRTHETYVRITDPATAPAERARLRAQQATAAEVVQQPLGCEELPDFPVGAREPRR